jgi:hypothetical protein
MLDELHQHQPGSQEFLIDGFAQINNHILCIRVFTYMIFVG